MNEDNSVRILIDDITGWCVHYLTESDPYNPVYFLRDQFHTPDPWGKWAHHYRTAENLHNSICVAIYNANQIDKRGTE